MAKLRDLVACLAAELDIPLKSMNVLAMELRKAGLIRSTGRGLNSADMGASDAANLILAALSGAYATQSAEAVQAIRAGRCFECTVHGFEDLIRGEDAPPPEIPVFERLPWPHTLGEFLDGYIEDHIQYGDIPLDDFCITNMSFSLKRDLLGWNASVWMDNGNHNGWTIRYDCNRPEIANAQPDKKADAARALLVGRGSGSRSVTETVIDGVFFDASLCIRNEYPLDLEDNGEAEAAE